MTAHIRSSRSGQIARQLVGVAGILMLSASGTAKMIEPPQLAEMPAVEMPPVETSATTTSGKEQSDQVEPGVRVGIARDLSISPGARFDLDCDYRGGIVANPEDRPTSSPYEPKIIGRTHYVVDLKNMRYGIRGFDPISDPRPILAAGDGQITFYKYRHFDLTLGLNLRRSDGYMVRRIVGDEGYLLETAGHCRVEPFSGFAAGEASTASN